MNTVTDKSCSLKPYVLLNQDISCDLMIQSLENAIAAGHADSAESLCAGADAHSGQTEEEGS